MQYNKSAFSGGSKELLSESIHIEVHRQSGYMRHREVPPIETYLFQISISF